MLQCVSGETAPLLDFLAGRSKYGLDKGKVTLQNQKNCSKCRAFPFHSSGFSGGCSFRAEFAMAVEGRVSLSELTAHVKQRTQLSLLVDRYYQPQELYKLKITFFFIRAFLEQIREHFIHLSLRVTDKQWQKFRLLHCVPEDFPPTGSDWQVPEALVNTLNGPPSNTIQTDFLWLSMLHFLTTVTEFSFSSKILNKVFALLQIFF